MENQVTNETAARPATLMQLGSCNADGMILGVLAWGPGGKTVRRTEWKNTIQLLLIIQLSMEWAGQCCLIVLRRL